MTGDDVDRRRVQVLEDIGQVLGVNGRDYELQEGDVVDLPADNTEALLERGAVEPIAEDGGDLPTLSGPPEPVVDDDGTVKLVRPSADGHDIRSAELGTWVCRRCGTTTETPVHNGEVQEPHECSGCERQGPFIHRILDEEPSRKGAAAPQQSDLAPSAFADPSWPTPSTISDEGYADLWEDVCDWIHTNWVTDEEHLYDGLTAFAISTWLRPNFNFLPQLLVMGKHETGKTRLLTTLARVSYRARTPVSFTPAALFRTVDKYDITLFLSEYHDLNDDLRDEVNAVIKGSQKRGEDVMRVQKSAGGEFAPVDFDIFTHVAIGTQFDPPDDIVSRCIQIQTKPADRDVPVWFDEERAEELRDRLLYARFRLLDSEEWDRAEQRSLKWLNDRGISGRLREKLLTLVTVADLWDQRDAIKPFVEAMETEAEEDAKDTDDALFIRAVRDLAFDELGSTTVLGDADPWEGLAIPLSDVADRFNDMTGRDIGPGYMGQIRGRLGLEKARHSDGVVIRDEELREKLEALCEQNNLDWEHSGYQNPIQRLEDHEKGKRRCGECGRDRFLTHRHVEEGAHLCEECADELQEVIDRE
ncbi:hypothetical protein BRC87_12240 [Halobacteriales archaeon QS_4_66_20]|nr:MAG: hypothetical protein BRC87_12240 [Halobacteriales archaeon QS_4_66_20]